jgi:hypothetical protein
MVGEDRLKSPERKRTARHTVADAYTRLWDFLWWPIAFVAGMFLSHEWLPQFAPWIIGARLGRWPEKVNISDSQICTDDDCETCLTLFNGEIDIDDERKIKHDRFTKCQERQNI